jgi:prepilin-type N-terminal cleavage/methylation domain-containing protein
MKRAKSGFTLIELLVTIAMIGILALIAIPRYMNYRTSAYNGAAESMSKNYEISQGAYRAAHGNYATDMNTLLTIDKNLLDTPNITFVWVQANSTGYTFNLKHARGDRWFTVTP